MPSPSQNFNIWTHFILRTTLWSWNHYLYFADEKTEVQIALYKVMIENEVAEFIFQWN